MMFEMLSNKNLTSFLIAIFVLIIVGVSLKNIATSLSPSQKKIDTSVHQVYAFGTNAQGQLGISPNDQLTGDFSLSFDENITEVAAGRNFSAVRTQDGNVYLWGGNDWGQLGFTTDLTREDTPTKNPYLEHIKQISTSNNHVVALTEDGHVKTFGSNFSGQLGTGDNTDHTTPSVVNGIDNVRSISAGYKFTIALKNDGTVWGWGASCDSSTKKEAELWWKNIIGNVMNVDGGYYDSNSDALVYYDKNEYCINEDIVGILSKVPVHIKGLERIIAISSGYGHILALDADGDVWSFGCNTFQQLGRVTKEKIDNTTPQKIEGLKNVVSISAGYRHSLALTENNTVFAWGLNVHGQLGTATTDSSPSPVAVSITDIAQIIAGYDYSLALKKDGTVWGWGMNREKWFIDADDEFVTRPTQMKNFENVREVAAGGGHILALKKQELQ
jgi:alpha-tubulin suppressor-like RCC1 family protein